jgi:hypothetical protein
MCPDIREATNRASHPLPAKSREGQGLDSARFFLMLNCWSGGRGRTGIASVSQMHRGGVLLESGLAT